MNFDIQDFTANQLGSVSKLIVQLWDNSAGEMPKELDSLFNEYVLRYYYVPSSNFNLVAKTDGEICGCLLAAPACDLKNNTADEWIKGRLHGADAVNCFNEIKSYIDSMRELEHQYANENEAILLFFASIQKGSGKALMAEFEKRCREQNIDSMLLWTDDSCNYEYYYRKGFEEVSKSISPTMMGGRNTTTWVFRKKFN